jgi:hypothetical protein
MRPIDSLRSARPLRLGVYALLPLLALSALIATLRHREWNEPFFVATAYYALLGLVAVYAGLQLMLPRQPPRLWWREHWPGVLVSALVAGSIVLAVKPSLRVLADEANLVGVSKNLFFKHAANFSVAGKWYFENYWDISVATDRRPALFPFLVSLVHLARGYRVENAFIVNAFVLLGLVWSSYRLGKSLAGQAFGLCAAILVAANPNTLIAARSAGFDVLATFFLVAVVKSFEEYLRERTPLRLAIYAVTLCLLAHVRYEGWALMLGGAAVPFVLRVVRRESFAGFGWLYASLPLFLLPRYWQTVAKAGDAEQPLSASLFSVKNFWRNWAEYFSVLKHPLDTDGPHAALLIPLAVLGTALVLRLLLKRLRARERGGALELALLVAGILGFETALSFSYDWGRPLHAASCRLFIWLDTWAGFTGAYALTLLGRYFPMTIAWLGRTSAAPIPLIGSAMLFAAHVPAAIEARFTNSLILTREAAQEWRFFERLSDKRILILCDRPGLFTIMDYGANHISLAQSDRGALYELSRHLYQDIYVIQELDLNSGEPLPGFAVWKDVEYDVAEEFQNTDVGFVRISRVRKDSLRRLHLNPN